MKPLLSLILFGILAGPIWADDQKEEKSEDLKLLQGKWQVVSVTTRGNDRPKEDLKDQTMTFNQNKCVIVDKIEVNCTFKIDPAKTPKHFDLTILIRDREVFAPGIYKLKEDKLTICLSVGKDAKEPPEAFESKEGSKTSLVVLEKIKEKKPKDE